MTAPSQDTPGRDAPGRDAPGQDTPGQDTGVVDVRRMRWWDIQAVRRLEEVLFAEDAWSEAMFWSELAERDTRHYVVAAAAAPETASLGAASTAGSKRAAAVVASGEAASEEAGVIVGYAGLCAYAADQCFVQTIGVDPAYQRRGIGSRLLHELIGEAERRDCRMLDLEVRAGNDAAIAMYEQFGFRAIGRRRGYYQPSGADAIVMRRESR